MRWGNIYYQHKSRGKKIKWERLSANSLQRPSSSIGLVTSPSASMATQGLYIHHRRCGTRTWPALALHHGRILVRAYVVIWGACCTRTQARKRCTMTIPTIPYITPVLYIYTHVCVHVSKCWLTIEEDRGGISLVNVDVGRNRVWSKVNRKKGNRWQLFCRPSLSIYIYLDVVNLRHNSSCCRKPCDTPCIVPPRQMFVIIVGF